MNNSIQYWQECLTQATSDFSSRICEVKTGDGLRRFAVLSQEELKSKNYIKKLSFKEITAISEKILEGTSYTFTSKDKKIKKIAAKSAVPIYISNISSKTVEDDVIKILKRTETNAQNFRSIHSSLAKMQERSRNKHVDEKTKNIWGRIKWFIWSHFYDKSKKINAIEKSIPSMIDISLRSEEKLKENILFNIDLFETEMKIEKAERNFFDSPDIVEKFYHPCKVRELWLDKYSEENYSETVTHLANHCRTKIETLVKAWETVKSYQSDLVKPDIFFLGCNS